MWAIIPIKWPKTPASDLWTPAQFAALMDESVPNTLGHYVSTATFGEVDFSYQLFEPVEMDDPRAFPLSVGGVVIVYAGRPDRSALVNAAHAAASKQKPLSQFSHFMYWYAQPTDLFGMPERAACVVQRDTPFDLMCHEVLHACGFEGHPWDVSLEYGSPYDIMSAATYGPWPGGPPTFWGTPPPAGFPGMSVSGMIGVGPLLSAAQLAGSSFRSRLQTAGLIHTLPANLSSTSAVRLIALDHACESWPTVLGPVVARTAPVGGPSWPPRFDEGFFFEFRRARGYDQGLAASSGAPNGSNPPAGVVVHRRGPDGRMMYEGVVPLERPPGDLDLIVRTDTGNFAVAVKNVGPNQEFVDIQIRLVGSIPTGHRVFVESIPKDGEPVDGEPTTVWIQPCFAAQVGPHDLTPTYTPRGFELTAQSTGYELPSFEWRVNDIPLPTGRSGGGESDVVSYSVKARVPDGKGGWTDEATNVEVAWKVDFNRLWLSVKPTHRRYHKTLAVGNFDLNAAATVREASPGVIKNNYPDRTAAIRLHFETVATRWDAAYQRAQNDCRDKLNEAFRKRIPPEVGAIPTPEPPWSNLLDQLRGVLRRSPEEGQLVVHDVADSVAVQPDIVLQDLFGGESGNGPNRRQPRYGANAD